MSQRQENRTVEGPRQPRRPAVAGDVTPPPVAPAPTPAPTPVPAPAPAPDDIPPNAAPPNDQADAGVPQGMDFESIINWVNGRPDRARAVIAAEQTTENPRATLLSILAPLAAE